MVEGVQANLKSKDAKKQRQCLRYLMEAVLVKDKDCNYFDWVDPQLPNQWYKNMLLEFHSRGIQAFNEEFEDYVEQPSVHVQGKSAFLWELEVVYLCLCVSKCLV
ncbi:hypothetical protein LXL04_015526 [Taraxacum kok-saghyz]